jgi:hypothetical protein
MHLRQLIISALIFSIGFLGCDNPEEVESNIQEIPVDIGKEQEVKYSDFIESVEYLQLKLPEDEFVGFISKVFFTDGYIGIVDDRGSYIWIFTDHGEYVNKIEVVIGQGPGEFLTLSDAVFGEDGEVHILGIYRINTFDFEGKLLKERQLPIATRTIEYLNSDSSFLAFMNNEIATPQGEDSLGLYNIYALNNNGEIINRHIPFSRQKASLAYLSRSNFYTLNNTLHHFSYLDENIYELFDANEVKVKYRLNYLDNKIPESVFEERKKYESGMEFREQEIEDPGYTRLRSFMETPNFLVVDVSYDETSGYLFHDKRSGKSVFTSGEAFINDFILGMKVFFHLSFDEHIYGISSVSRIQSLANEKEGNDEELTKLLNQFSGNEGPVLIKAKLK